MKLIKPEGGLSQGFGGNANASYSEDGLKGHTAEDYALGYHRDIKCAVTGEVYSIMNEHNPDTDKYRAVFQLIDDTDYSYEVSYGHINTSYYREGQIAIVGTPIATEGNYGLCFVGGVQVTPAQKATGMGSHMHFQVRKLVRVKVRDSKKHYIRNSEGLVKRNGFLYEVVDYDNGYNGCIDPKQFYDGYLKPKFVFERNLTLNSKGEDVKELQKFLNNNGFTVSETGLGSKGNETDYFGVLTRTALSQFQYANKISPSAGYFGPVTRNRINSLMV